MTGQGRTAVGTVRDEIFARCLYCLGEVLGPEAMAVLRVSRDTTILGELGLTSLDLIAIVERLNHWYPVADQWARWLGAKSVPELTALTVGDVVEFISDALA
jgi:hypothetical protein